MSNQASPLDIYEYYTRLEPNHDVEIDEDGFQAVVCPFEITDDGEVALHDHPVEVTISYSPSAGPEEVDCPRCEVFNGKLRFAGPPPHEHPNEPDGDDSPAIGGGAHGSRHRVTEYAPCKIPARRWTWCGVEVLGHEGLISKIAPVDEEYERRVAAGETWRVRQADTAFYVCRKIAGSSSWSKHAYGCAGDVNWQTAPYGTRRRDHPKWFSDAMKRCGMGDGIEWSTPDPMHYSAFENEGGDGWLYVGSTQPGRLFMALTEAQEKDIHKAAVEVLLSAGGKPLDRYIRDQLDAAEKAIALKLDVLAGEDEQRDLRAIAVLEELRVRPPDGVSEVDARAVVDEFFRRLES